MADKFKVAERSRSVPSRFAVVKFVALPDNKDTREPVKTNLSHALAVKLWRSLNEAEETKDFDPNQVVCYIVEPA